MTQEENDRYAAIADQVVPEYRGDRVYSCTGHCAKRWNAAYDGARIALGGDMADILARDAAHGDTLVAATYAEANRFRMALGNAGKAHVVRVAVR